VVVERFKRASSPGMSFNARARVRPRYGDERQLVLWSGTMFPRSVRQGEAAWHDTGGEGEAGGAAARREADSGRVAEAGGEIAAAAGRHERARVKGGMKSALGSGMFDFVEER